MCMKLAEKLLVVLGEDLPSKAKIGTIYKKVTVDGEEFKDMELLNINTAKAELEFKGPKRKHYFNYVEQEVVLS